MTKKEIIFFSCCFLIAAFSACQNQKADLVYPQPPAKDTSVIVTCDTTNITLSVDLTEIMKTNCFSCHGGAADLGSGIQLEDYSTIKDYADFGLLLSSIKQDGTTSPMPKDGPKLSDCDISKFEAWVNQGSPNN